MADDFWNNTTPENDEERRKRIREMMGANSDSSSMTNFTPREDLTPNFTSGPAAAPQNDIGTLARQALYEGSMAGFVPREEVSGIRAIIGNDGNLTGANDLSNQPDYLKGFNLREANRVSEQFDHWKNTHPGEKVPFIVPLEFAPLEVFHGDNRQTYAFLSDGSAIPMNAGPWGSENIRARNNELLSQPPIRESFTNHQESVNTGASPLERSLISRQPEQPTQRQPMEESQPPLEPPTPLYESPLYDHSEAQEEMEKRRRQQQRRQLGLTEPLESSFNSENQDSYVPRYKKWIRRR
jgi:hypothetical protein